MTSRDVKAAQAILRHCTRLMDTVARVKTYDAFIADADASDAAVMRIGQIGELSRRELSNEFKATLPSVPWKEVYSLRNRIVHGYDSLNFVIIWQVMCEDIPALTEVLEEVVSRFRGTSGGLNRMSFE